MRTMKDTEVSRDFASVLDRAARGETIVITRDGRHLATLSPAAAGRGANVKAFLEAHVVDEDFAADVESAREWITDESSGTWRDG
jgi:antitoxin (DNA-binding transcriptional repressor) of toxin-antitoxin stability system